MRYLLLLALVCAPHLRAEETPVEDPAAAARRSALDMAGAFSNDGYRMRDAYHSGTIEAGKPVFIEVSLFPGNEYWFVAGAGKPARRLAVSVFGGDGKPVEFLEHADGAVAAAGVEPDRGGRHFVRIEMTEGEKAPFCLVYTYK